VRACLGVCPCKQHLYWDQTCHIWSQTASNPLCYVSLLVEGLTTGNMLNICNLEIIS
jgi:hypothetical protein